MTTRASNPPPGQGVTPGTTARRVCSLEPGTPIGAVLRGTAEEAADPVPIGSSGGA